MEPYFISALDYARVDRSKPSKHTFFQSERLLVGLNTLASGQAQHLHDHPQQDKFYFVVEGTGHFTVGDAIQECSAGMLVLAPAGVIHGVTNAGTERLVFLTVIAPFGAAHT